jgi:hypothetical protein
VKRAAVFDAGGTGKKDDVAHGEAAGYFLHSFIPDRVSGEVDCLAGLAGGGDDEAGYVSTEGLDSRRAVAGRRGEDGAANPAGIKEESRYWG